MQASSHNPPGTTHAFVRLVSKISKMPGSLTFTADSIPDLRGRSFIVTGGNSGIGFETAKQLALHGGSVTIATHPQDPSGPSPPDLVDGPSAVAQIKREDSSADVAFMELDLSSFRSIQRFVDTYKASGRPLHCLINNAGLQTVPDDVTADGFEVTLGVNFYGPLYLTQLLLPLLKQSAAPDCSARVVWVSSPEEALGQTDWDNLKGAGCPSDINAYATSKLWDLMAAFEMNERLKGSGVESFACHPGLTRTDIFRKGDSDKMTTVITDWAQWLAGQPASSAALSLLYCATSPDLQGHGGSYYGAYYKGPFTTNLLSTSQRTPGNPEANDPAARARLYDAALGIINQAAHAVAGDAGDKTGADDDSAGAASGDRLQAAASTTAGAAAGGGEVGDMSQAVAGGASVEDLVAAATQHMGLSEGSAANEPRKAVGGLRGAEQPAGSVAEEVAAAAAIDTVDGIPAVALT